MAVNQADPDTDSSAVVQAGSVWQVIETDDTHELRQVSPGAWPDALDNISYVLMVEQPARALAQALAAHDTLSPTRAVAEWLLSASQLRNQLRRLRHHTIVFDSAEIRCIDADKLTDYGAWATRLPAIAQLQAEADPDPLLLLASEPLMATNPEALAVFEELHAACELVDESVANLPHISTDAALNALQSLQQLRQELKKGIEASSSLKQALAQAQGLVLERDQATQELASIRTVLDAQRIDTQAAQTEARELLTQLHATQEELEQSFVALKSSEEECRQLADRAKAAAASHEEELQRLVTREQTEARTLLALQAQVADIEPLIAQLRHSQADSEALLLQLHQTQEELERLSLEHQAATEKYRKDVANLQERVQAAETVQATEVSALQTLQTQLSEAQVCIGLQQQQLDTLNEELLYNYLRLKTYESVAAPNTAPAFHANFAQGRPTQDSSPAMWQDIAIGPMHQRPPHSHMDIVLTHARAPTGHFEQLQVRLLEHNDRPGLAFLRQPEQPPVLGHWAEHCREGELGVMLLIPEDEQGTQTLQRLPSSDWTFVNQVVAGILTKLAQQTDGPSAHWQAVAGKLQLLLAQLPARLRYDALSVDAVDDEAQVVAVQMNQVVFGSRFTNALTLHWRPGAGFSREDGATALMLVRPSGATSAVPLFSGWPLHPQGGWTHRWTVPVGQGLTGQRLRSQWAEIGPSDRDLLLALLDALPAAAAHLGRVPGMSAWTEPVATREAQLLFKQARNAIRALRFRSALRRLVRR
jgi:chemotaxis protein histidine kinase CheA